MPQKLAIIDYGVGNLHSVYKKMQQLKADVFVTANPKEIRGADKIILPGIGNFGRGIQNLRNFNLVEVLNEEVLVCKKPVLGICLGLQLMAVSSEEAPEEKGLGWLEGTVVRFHVSDTTHIRIPHIGWNQLELKKENVLTQNLSISAEFYFSHSYHLAGLDASIVLAETMYGYPFVSAVSREHIFGVQFHPEKSHEQGIKIFENFLNF